MGYLLSFPAQDFIQYRLTYIIFVSHFMEWMFDSFLYKSYPIEEVFLSSTKDLTDCIMGQVCLNDFCYLYLHWWVVCPNLMFSCFLLSTGLVCHHTTNLWELLEWPDTKCQDLWKSADIFILSNVELQWNLKLSCISLTPFLQKSESLLFFQVL